MPNYCDNFLSINASPDTLNRITDFVKSNENAFDFDKIVPMPDHIYRGSIGSEEKALYGENNWYDWSCKNWGTKWNSVDAEINDEEIHFLTAWSPCDPVIAALAAMFPAARITYNFYETGMCFCGQRIYENGELIFYFNGDYAENPFCEDNDEDSDEYALSDPIFPIKESGVFEAVQDSEAVQGIEALEGCTRGKLYYREYANGKIRVMTDGYFIADKKFSFEFAPEQLTSTPKVA